MDEIDELVAWLLGQLDEDAAEALETADADSEFWAGVSGDGTHFARHDPARVLRDIEAKRRIIATAELMLNGGVIYESWESVLQDLALPFDSRPGYRPEWKP